LPYGVVVSVLDGLYTALITASGVHRIRDTRLEMLAMDRALEARYEVGTDGAAGIPHPIAQLIARTYPHRALPTHSVHENCVWSYRADWQEDFVPKVVEAWMGSDLHRDNLLRASDTTWGLGYHVESVPGQTNKRIYVCAEFTTALAPLIPRRVAFQAGTHFGQQYTANGAVIAKKTKTLATAQGSDYDVRAEIPGKGPHLHIVNGMWKGYWMPESSKAQAATI
jgi:hypothetical protein